MSAAATAAGYLYASGRLRHARKAAKEPQKPDHAAVDALARHLEQKFNISEKRAKELAAEQATKPLKRAPAR